MNVESYARESRFWFFYHSGILNTDIMDQEVWPYGLDK